MGNKTNFADHLDGYPQYIETKSENDHSFCSILKQNVRHNFAMKREKENIFKKAPEDIEPSTQAL